MEDFASFIDSIRLNVNRYLNKIAIPDTPRYLYDPIRYSIRDGGKRFRPILTHLSGRANNIDSDALMNLSIAVELLHNFTLVHDDIMDNDTIRRGKPSTHIKFGEASAVLAGSSLLTLAFEIISDKKNLISEIKPLDLENLIKWKVVQGGMIPKIQNCVDAVQNGVRGVVILDGRKPHSILHEIFSDKGSGTLIRE